MSLNSIKYYKEELVFQNLGMVYSMCSALLYKFNAKHKTANPGFIFSEVFSFYEQGERNSGAGRWVIKTFRARKNISRLCPEKYDTTNALH